MASRVSGDGASEQRESAPVAVAERGSGVMSRVPRAVSRPPTTPLGARLRVDGLRHPPPPSRGLGSAVGAGHSARGPVDARRWWTRSRWRPRHRPRWVRAGRRANPLTSRRLDRGAADAPLARRPLMGCNGGPWLRGDITRSGRGMLRYVQHERVGRWLRSASSPPSSPVAPRDSVGTANFVHWALRQPEKSHAGVLPSIIPI